MGYFQVRYDSRVVIYECKMFIRLATELWTSLNAHQMYPEEVKVGNVESEEEAVQGVRQVLGELANGPVITTKLRQKLRIAGTEITFYKISFLVQFGHYLWSFYWHCFHGYHKPMRVDPIKYSQSRPTWHHNHHEMQPKNQRFVWDCGTVRSSWSPVWLIGHGSASTTTYLSEVQINQTGGQWTNL